MKFSIDSSFSYFSVSEEDRQKFGLKLIFGFSSIFSPKFVSHCNSCRSSVRHFSTQLGHGAKLLAQRHSQYALMCKE